jgi:hypothetical protein
LEGRRKSKQRSGGNKWRRERKKSEIRIQCIWGYKEEHKREGLIGSCVTAQGEEKKQRSKKEDTRTGGGEFRNHRKKGSRLIGRKKDTYQVYTEERGGRAERKDRRRKID